MEKHEAKTILKDCIKFPIYGHTSIFAFGDCWKLCDRYIRLNWNNFRVRRLNESLERKVVGF